MKHIVLRRAGALLLTLVMAFSLVPAALAADDYSIDPPDCELQVGQTRDLYALAGVTAPSSDITVNWTSENPDIVSIQRDYGDSVTILAKKPTEEGEPAVIKAEFIRDGETVDEAECAVTVLAARVTGVKLNKEKLTLVVDGSEQLIVTVLPEEADNKAVKWSVSNPEVVRMNSRTGEVFGLMPGETVVTVTTEEGGYTASCLVEVKAAVAVTGVTIGPVPPVVQTSPKTLSLEREGQTEQLTATVAPTDATNKTVTWDSDDKSVVTVNDKGLVKAVAPGIATVTAVSGSNPNAVDSCVVTVSGITLSKSTVSLKVGQSDSVIATPYGRAKGNRLIWESEDPTVASGGNDRVVGISIGTTRIRVYAPNTNYEKYIDVTVAENTARIDDAVNAGDMLYFSSLISKLHGAAREGTGDSSVTLQSITNVSVATKEGIVHYGYVSPDVPNHGVGGSEVYYINPNASKGEQSISDLKYIPASGFSGTAVISYVGRSSKNETFNGTIYVTVKESGDVMFSTAAGRPLTLTAQAFRDICKLRNGRSASYVTFSQPSAGKGTLYYNYVSASQWAQKVDGTTKYYLSSTPSVEKVTFVPAQNYTGTVSIPYRCTDTTGSSFSGVITINVYANGGSALGDVQYTTGVNQRVTLNASDFDSACLEENGRRLNHILFDALPAASEGILYYNYTSASSNRVDTATNYYRSTSPRISSITFVPATNFSGVVSIPYTGFDAAGQTYKDQLVINVSDAAGTVYYTTAVDGPVTFRTEDFNDACLRANGASLNYITFIQPSSSLGTLYRNYRSSTNTGTRVSSSSTRFYRGGSPSISEVTFVPRSRYEGTVSIAFGGKDVNGDAFEGKVNISVGQGTGRVVSYSVASAGVVRFSASDFNAACRTATGEDLNYVTFELPASRYGTLYYQYNTARGSGTLVSASNSYYRVGGSSHRLLDDVYFVSANVNGVASFLYTARSTGGKQFTGTVEIAIGNAALNGGYSNGTYYIGSAAPIALRTADFEQACRTAIGGSLSYIRFTSLPSESVGRLYMNYASPSRPGGEATTTSNYTVSSGLTIGQLSFVPKAGYEGQVQIPYTGYTAQGSSFSGSVVINVSVSYCATPFYDVDYGWDWAKSSVEFLRWAGISNGYSDGSFRPSRSISRGEFTLMVCRAFGFDTTARVSSFPDVPASSPYAGAIATAKSMGIVEGSGGRFRPDSPITRQSAMAIICRAMKAAGQKLPTTGSSTLNAYKDHAQIASHARESVAALVSLGVVQGSTDMRINPTRSISRAEMAVILHRVLTL